MAPDCPRPRGQEPGEGDVQPPAGMVREGTRSLEVRWIFPGQMETGVARWLGRFPSETESREDIYLVNPGLHGLSVKIRAGTALEVKEYRGSRGTLLVAGRVSGHMQSWQKWSFPFNPLSPGIGDPPGWRPVYKHRRTSRFSFAEGRVAGVPSGWRGRRGARWNSPRSVRMASPGGPWDSKPPAGRSAARRTRSHCLARVRRAPAGWPATRP